MSEKGVFRASYSENEKYIYQVNTFNSWYSEVEHTNFKTLDEAFAQVQRYQFDDIYPYEDIHIVRTYDNHLIWSENDSPNMQFYCQFDRDHWQALTHIDREISDKPSVYFDIDGTLAYWYQDTKGMVYPDQVLDPSTHYFRNIAPHPFMIDLAQKLQEQGIDVCIVSAADIDTIRDKTEWIKEKCPFIKDENIFFCPLGADKTPFIKGNADKSVLVDDYKGNLDKWAGISVKAINSINSVDDKYICVEGYKAEQDLSQYELIMNKAIYDIKTAIGMEGRSRSSTKENQYEKIINNDNDISFALYQTKMDLPENKDISFMPYKHIENNNIVLSKNLYDCVYASQTSSSKINEPRFLDSLYYRFNGASSEYLPEYQGRSMSMSDIVVINNKGSKEAFYVDKFGYVKLDNFLENNKSIDAVKDMSNNDKIEAAKQGKYLDILVNDPNPNVRIAVAEQGRPQDLEKLSFDDNSSVKVTVIKQGYQSEKLLSDDSWIVRCAIAKQGREDDLNILVYDEDPRVRCEVAKQGYGLDKLVKDDNSNVLVEVVKQGRKKDIDYLLHNVKSLNVDIKCAIADEGFGLDVLSNDDSVAVKVRVSAYRTSHKNDISPHKEDVEKIVDAVVERYNKQNIKIDDNTKTKIYYDILGEYEQNGKSSAIKRAETAKLNLNKTKNKSDIER